MEMIHHFFCQGFGVVIFVFQEIFKRVDVEERSYRDVTIVLAEVAPLHEFRVEFGDIAARGIVSLENSLEEDVVTYRGKNFVDELRIEFVVLIFFDERDGGS